MTDELETTPLPDAEEAASPLAETLDDLAATVETASDRAATTVDDMQTAAEEVTAAAATGEAVTTDAAATVGEAATDAAATVGEIAAPIAETGAAVAASAEEYVELPTAPAVVLPAAEELRAGVDDMSGVVVAQTPVQPAGPPEAVVPPLPAAVAAPAATTMPGDVTSDDRLISALNWLGLVLLQLPLVSIVILLAEGNKNRPFQRHHAIQGIGFWVGAIVYEIVAVLVFTVGSIVTLGLGALCLWVIFFLPHLLALVYAWQAWQGKELSIPVVTKFMKQQGWLA